MRGDGSSSAVGVGCAAFSLLGVLLSIGIVVWLSSKALPDSDKGAKVRGGATETTVKVPDTAALDVSLSRATGLAETTPIVVTVKGLEPRATFSVATCLQGGSLVTGSRAPCDEPSARRSTADNKGEATVPYRPARLITVGGVPYDSASGPQTCKVQVVQVSVPTDGKSRTGSAGITFRDDLPRPEITVDTGG